MSNDNLSKLKNVRATDKIAALMDKLSSVEGGGDKKKSYNDERLWKPTLDKSGNGSAIIRFLPPAAGEELPFVKMYSHFFRGPTGAVYAENSLTTLNQKDPVSEYNSQLWNSGVEANKQVVRDQKRKLNYFANILVVNDPKEPENNGKVFLFKFGTKIMDKINDVMFPPQDELSETEAVYPFDLFEGADFKLVVRKVDGYPNYDRSTFLTPGPVQGGDAFIASIAKQQYSLAELVAPENFKSYADLKAKLESVLGLNGATPPKGRQKAAPTEEAAEEENFTMSQSSSFDDVDDISALIDEL